MSQMDEQLTFTAAFIFLLPKIRYNDYLSNKIISSLFVLNIDIHKDNVEPPRFPLIIIQCLPGLLTKSCKGDWENNFNSM